MHEKIVVDVVFLGSGRKMLLRTQDSTLETAYRFKLRARPNFGLRPEGSHLSSRSDLGSVPRSGPDQSFLRGVYPVQSWTSSTSSLRPPTSGHRPCPPVVEVVSNKDR
ncbi:hypothetical protein J6590_048760 [Homalodisca vitripennis]|nr:hypothetical protein J6590_048760 [Homalodisca vitripennis]